MNKHYQKGYRQEREIVNHLRRLGWLSVRTAGSHSPIDIFCVKGDRILLIQSKSNGRKGNHSYYTALRTYMERYDRILSSKGLLLTKEWRKEIEGWA